MWSRSVCHINNVTHIQFVKEFTDVVNCETSQLSVEIWWAYLFSDAFLPCYLLQGWSRPTQGNIFVENECVTRMHWWHPESTEYLILNNMKTSSVPHSVGISGFILVWPLFPSPPLRQPRSLCVLSWASMSSTSMTSLWIMTPWSLLRSGCF